MWCGGHEVHRIWCRLAVVDVLDAFPGRTRASVGWFWGGGLMKRIDGALRSDKTAPRAACVIL